MTIAQQLAIVAILKVHCGACHFSDPVASNPKALKVFDLKNPDWSSYMTVAQLNESVKRLKDRSTMTPLELKEVVPRGAPVPPRPTKEEVKELEDYVRAEALKRL